MHFLSFPGVCRVCSLRTAIFRGFVLLLSLVLINIFKGKHCKHIDIQLPDIDNVLEMVSRLNKEVKHPTCPNNLRNRFYSKKKIFIQNLLHKRLVDKIIESDRYYNFIVGEYSFHQPKVYFPDGIKDIDGTEVYKPIVPEIPFSMDDYKNTMMGMVYFMCF
jgi:hypothetical protein